MEYFPPSTPLSPLTLCLLQQDLLAASPLTERSPHLSSVLSHLLTSLRLSPTGCILQRKKLKLKGIKLLLQVHPTSEIVDPGF